LSIASSHSDNGTAALRFPSRSGRTASLLERAPLRALLEVARHQARIRPLGREPGWRFEAPAEDESPDVTFRRELWAVFHDDGAQRSVTVRWYDGLRVRLFLGNDLSRCLFVGGSFEPNEFALVAKILEPDMVVVDGGANDGLYSLFAASRVGRGGRVVAVEPSRRELERLRANLRLNRLNNVEVREAALGSKHGTAQIAIAERAHEGQNTLGSRIANREVMAVRQETVTLETVDEIVDDLALERLDLIKLDVEGSEVEALKGASGAISRFRPLLLVEVEAERLASQSATKSDLLELVDSFGYELFVFDPATAQLRPARDPEEPEGNAVAAPAGWRAPAL
jgi:FkbM family methyltransferase